MFWSGLATSFGEPLVQLLLRISWQWQWSTNQAQGPSEGRSLWPCRLHTGGAAVSDRQHSLVRVVQHGVPSPDKAPTILFTCSFTNLNNQQTYLFWNVLDMRDSAINKEVKLAWYIHHKVTSHGSEREHWKLVLGPPPGTDIPEVHPLTLYFLPSQHFALSFMVGLCFLFVCFFCFVF